MDPDQALKEMRAAVSEGDMETAKERAQALKEWHQRGGFCPRQAASWQTLFDEIDQLADNV